MRAQQLSPALFHYFSPDSTHDQNTEYEQISGDKLNGNGEREIKPQSLEQGSLSLSSVT